MKEGAKEIYKAFWATFHEVMKKEGATFTFDENYGHGGNRWGKVNDSAAGFQSAPAFIGGEVSVQKKRIRANIYIPNDKKLFRQLEEDKENIEKTFGDKLDWEYDCGMASRIIKDLNGFDVKNKSLHPQIARELIRLLERFIVTFDHTLVPYRNNMTEHEKMRAELTSSLRFKVFRRDNYNCRICGRSSTDGVTLHIDHIIPIAKGGTSELDNLQTLCKDCNQGKGTKFM